MTPDKLRERRRARIEKKRRPLANAAMAEAMASMFREPTAKDWLLGMAFVAAILAVVIVPMIYFTF